MLFLALAILQCGALVAVGILIYRRRNPYVGCVIVINGRCRVVLDYDATRRVMTISPYGEAPATGSVFTLTLAGALP